MQIMDFNNENIEWLMQTSQTVEEIVDDSSDEINTTFLQILGKECLSETVQKESTAFGILRSEECFRDLLRKLKAFGYFFAVRTSRSSRGTKVKIFHKSPEHIQITQPYSVKKCIRFYCSANQNGNPCRAFMIVRQVDLYTNFPRSSERHQLINRKLRKSIANGTAKSEQQLWISVSLPRAHNHTITEPDTARRGLDLDVKATMLQITANGSLTVNDVKTKLQNRIDNEFAGNCFKPSPDNRAFFPSDKVIYNHLRENGLTKSKMKSNELEKLRLEINNMLCDIKQKVSKIESKPTLKKILAWLSEFEKL